jgi:lipoprotein-releasing system permease protein
MIETRIARRYLWAARKRAHTAVLSFISIMGLAVGVAALLISIALLSGLQGQIKRRLIASSPQILVEPAELNTIEDYEAIVAEGKRLGMKDVRPLVSGIGYGGNIVEERGRPIRLRSYQAGQEPRADTMRGGTAPLPEGEVGIFVRRDYAASIGLTAGEEIPVIAPRTRLTPFGPMPASARTASPGCCRRRAKRTRPTRCSRCRRRRASSARTGCRRRSRCTATPPAPWTCRPLSRRSFRRPS